MTVLRGCEGAVPVLATTALTLTRAVSWQISDSGVATYCISSALELGRPKAAEVKEIFVSWVKMLVELLIDQGNLGSRW